LGRWEAGMNKIAVIYTTFLRDILFLRTFKSISLYWAGPLFIGDQGRENGFKYAPSAPRPGLTYLTLPFDCGVSYARNRLIELADQSGFEYIILSADSIEFTRDTVSNMDKGVQFLDSHPEVGILGFDLNNRAPWEYFMDIQNSSFLLTKNPVIEADPGTGLRIKRCDICRQIFLAKTETILKVKWDEALKTGEHEDFFWRYKQAGYKVCFTPDIACDYVDYKPADYLKYRERQYKEFRNILFAKYKLNSWVTYA
jgi:GT2 family glycosyltransferase